MPLDINDILKLMHNTEKIDLIKEWLGTGSVDIFGRPFAGKDNQCKRLKNCIGGNLIGGGDILRNSNMTHDIKSCMRTGKLIPSEDYISIVLPFLSQSSLADKPLFLSSVGRWHGEETGVIKALDSARHKLMSVIYLDISEENAFERWTRRDSFNDRGQRHDDSSEILKIRLKEFSEKTMPVIDFYRDMGLLIQIDGTGSRDEVEQTIIEELYQLASRV